MGTYSTGLTVASEQQARIVYTRAARCPEEGVCPVKNVVAPGRRHAI
jgi:hypothetical protein